MELCKKIDPKQTYIFCMRFILYVKNYEHGDGMEL